MEIAERRNPRVRSFGSPFPPALVIARTFSLDAKEESGGEHKEGVTDRQTAAHWEWEAEQSLFSLSLSHRGAEAQGGPITWATREALCMQILHTNT